MRTVLPFFAAAVLLAFAAATRIVPCARCGHRDLRNADVLVGFGAVATVVGFVALFAS